ncbi:unnamed protein product [Prorocentrum cordatum]|uniref:Nucleotide-diphospho-sugar transferase domain-containing protein n=1 Tax=Prorocentrum cordatum TaxID=2364126 RepID=A0ABN9S0F7_9DINO|nr:unnamed protein product [Polarella glacialis]
MFAQVGFWACFDGDVMSNVLKASLTLSTLPWLLVVLLWHTAHHLLRQPVEHLLRSYAAVPFTLVAPSTGRCTSDASLVHFFSHLSSPDPERQRLFAEAGRIDILNGYASSSIWIDRVHTYTELPPELLGDARWEKHLNASRGHGFWFWKVALANLLLKSGRICDRDVLIYTDSDFACFAKPQFDAYIQGVVSLLEATSVDMVVQPQPEKLMERKWTKGDVFRRFGTDWRSYEFGGSAQITSQRFALRVNNRTREFLHQWETLASDFQLISDAKSISPDPPGSVHYRHDQSLFSMLVKATVASTSHMRFGVANLTIAMGDGFGHVHPQCHDAATVVRPWQLELQNQSNNQKAMQTRPNA